MRVKHQIPLPMGGFTVDGCFKVGHCLVDIQCHHERYLTACFPFNNDLDRLLDSFCAVAFSQGWILQRHTQRQLFFFKELGRTRKVDNALGFRSSVTRLAMEADTGEAMAAPQIWY